ncbi:iron-containing alcohol dehydrogenase-domain containing protein [Phakopsora pachyrhizi]|uniref:hydroxyacid-oxoacid transhydrogenase n=1 Tax=Phakopsora pachyrhizi TaxID=170000 RepID=A0AAV0BV42_PHAPC|nr:iron-containing alcohol dehydrogenase-domain containing protein [Phakopsora pachyrhizi]CAH7690091.1 iron-containing alcohol dehydrogenase-domain containing protein [Phakopsora pachyrhizi]
MSVARSNASRALRLINLAQQSFAGCKTHSYGCSCQKNYKHLEVGGGTGEIRSLPRSLFFQPGEKVSFPTGGSSSYSSEALRTETEYAFEISAAQLRFGEGVTREVGMDFKNMKANKVGVFTDKTISKLHPLKVAIESLESQGIEYEIFDDCKVEPNQESWERAVSFTRSRDFSHFLAVGGGSVIDTCKVSNLFSCYPEAELLDFVNAPIGRGLPISKTLKPLIAVPTTAGTGSETTGTAIFDYTTLQAKTGIANRALRPTLGIVDPLNTDSCPVPVHINSGLDVLFHSLESYTAIPYNERVPRPSNPIYRPAYQGRNPISDVFSLWALNTTVKYLPRVARDPTDKEAKSQMLLASTFAGIGFGNAGVHLCHGFSYPISGLNKKLAKFDRSGYEVTEPLVPHGLSVALTGPAVFKFTSDSSPDRHREVSEIFRRNNNDSFGSHASSSFEKRISDSDLGSLVHDRIAEFLVGLGLPRGLKGIGYSKGDVDQLVAGTLPQKRVLDLAPGNTEEESLRAILKDAMEF